MFLAVLLIIPHSLRAHPERPHHDIAAVSVGRVSQMLPSRELWPESYYEGEPRSHSAEAIPAVIGGQRKRAHDAPCSTFEDAWPYPCTDPRTKRRRVDARDTSVSATSRAPIVQRICTQSH